MKYDREAFAVREGGLKVYLKPDQMASDEYADADPYNVEEELSGPFHQRRIDLTMALLKDAVKERGAAATILDIGCGEGHITALIAKAYPQAEVSGLDFSVTAVEYARKHFSQIDFIAGDAMEAPYAPGYFDIVVCNNLWEHVPDPMRMLARIRTILKPGGLVIISTPSRYRIGNLIRVMLGRRVKLISKHHVTEYSVGQVREQLSFGGFRTLLVVTRGKRERRLLTSIAKWLLSGWTFITNSDHVLEATAFYLARRRPS